MSNILAAVQDAITNVRNQIVETITNDIGTYTFPDGTSDPAIAVLGLGSNTQIYPPQGTSITGLEVILVTMNSIRIANRLDGVIESVATQIVLKQFDQTKNTMSALFKLLTVLDTDSDPIRTIPDPLVGNIEVCEFRILHSFYSNNEDY